MLTRLEQPVPEGMFDSPWYGQWEQERKEIHGDQVEWLSQNIRHPEFCRLTLFTDFMNYFENVAEWRLEQPECLLGAAMYVYLWQQRFDPAIITGPDCNPEGWIGKRQFKLKLRAAKGIREGRYANMAFDIPGGGSKLMWERSKVEVEELKGMIDALPESHAMRIPLSAFDVKFVGPARNHCEWELEDGCRRFVTTYNAWYRDTIAPTIKPKPKKPETRRERRQRNRDTTKLLGVMAVGLVASFLKGRR